MSLSSMDMENKICEFEQHFLLSYVSEISLLTSLGNLLGIYRYKCFDSVNICGLPGTLLGIFCISNCHIFIYFIDNADQNIPKYQLNIDEKSK